MFIHLNIVVVGDGCRGGRDVKERFLGLILSDLNRGGSL